MARLWGGGHYYYKGHVQCGANVMFILVILLEAPYLR